MDVEIKKETAEASRLQIDKLRTDNNLRVLIVEDNLINQKGPFQAGPLVLVRRS